MRIIFAGSPAIAVPALWALSEMEMEGLPLVLAGILTNRDSKRGRHGHLEPTEISAEALKIDAIRKERGLAPIPQLKPGKLDEQARKDVAALGPELLVSFACGHFFGPRFLSLFPMGGINIHPSLLPKYRGSCPIPAAILGREKEMGICIQKLAPELDAGNILMQDRFGLSGRETASSLSETVSRRAALLLRELLLDFKNKNACARPQEGEAVYCREINKEAGLIDWNKSAVEIDARIRAYTPWPLSFTRLGNETLIVLEARVPESADGSDGSGGNGKTGQGLAADACRPGKVLGTGRDGILIQTGNGILSVSRLQWQAKKALDWKAFLNGSRNFIGAQLG